MRQQHSSFLGKFKMAKLVILYDEENRLHFNSEQLTHLNIKEASLSISDNLENEDIYTLARKLAEMLLEQL
jgi:hypothetical protein